MTTRSRANVIISSPWYKHSLRHREKLLNVVNKTQILMVIYILHQRSVSVLYKQHCQFHNKIIKWVVFLERKCIVQHKILHNGFSRKLQAMSSVKGYSFRNQFHQRGLPSLSQPNTITMFACSLVSPSSPLEIKTQKDIFSFKLSFSYFKILIMGFRWYWVLIHSQFCKYELHWTFIVLNRTLS